jgi:tetratricopeptide (TPR) repeat protein
MRRTVLATLNLALAAGILVVGFPSMTAALRRLPSELVIEEIEAGQRAENADFDAALSRLESAEASSPAAHLDVALLLLARPDALGAAGANPAERAAEELRRYLAEVPGDAQGWTALAGAELQRGRRDSALAALKMSMLIAPYASGLALWRCGLGLDLYGALDEDGRRLLERQFSIAAENRPELLVRLVRQRKALLLARVLLVQDPGAMAKFEAQWSAAQ